MCGIVGYVGNKSAVSVLMVGLTKLEYRGYDSAGVAVHDGEQVLLRREVGKLRVLEDSLHDQPIDGHTGIGHCLEPDTLIQMADGRLVPISRLRGEVEILALDSKSMRLVPRTARVFCHAAPTELVEIRVPQHTLRCTAFHRMIVVNAETGALEERLAGDLQAGDLLPVARKLPVVLPTAAASPTATALSAAAMSPAAPTSNATGLSFPPRALRRYWSLPEPAISALRRSLTDLGETRMALAASAGLSPSAVYHLFENDRNVAEANLSGVCRALGIAFPPAGALPVHSRHGNFVRLPETLTPALAQIVGYFWGDGCAHERCVRWKDDRREVLQRYQELAQGIFGIAGRIAPVPQTRAWLLEINSREMADWFRAEVQNRRQDWLERLGAHDEAIVAAFLRGLFDAEASVAHQAGQVSLRMTDLDLVRHVQQWLLRLEITSSFSIDPPAPAQRRPRACAGVSLSSRSALRRFAERVGFSATDKRRALQSLLDRESAGVTISGKPIPIRKPTLQNWLRAAGVPSSMLRPFRGEGFLSETQARRLLTVALDFPRAAPIVDLLQTFLDGDMTFQSVQSVRTVPSPSAWVYDLEVPHHENFLANGILTHNSRWATHGEPNTCNAHPHRDASESVFVCHNGIIENYAEIKDELQKAGVVFRSQTDTEVLPNLIKREYDRLTDSSGDERLVAGVRAALSHVRGAYAIAVLHKEHPSTLVAARQMSPLVVGLGSGENFCASDVPAILNATHRVLFLDDGEMALLTPKKVSVLDIESGRERHKAEVKIEWSPEEAEKGGYAHYMLKEIHEQPDVMNRLLARYTNPDRTRVLLDGINLSDSELKGIRRIFIQACGTSWHAGLIGKLFLERLPMIAVDVDTSSEFRYRNVGAAGAGAILSPDTLVVAISQSGETADTLAGVREARSRGLKVVSIVNVPGSTIARESDGVIYTNAGPEIGVASTKAYTAQLGALYLLSLHLGALHGAIDEARMERRLSKLSDVANLMARILEDDEALKRVAQVFAHADNAMFIGRGFGYPSALEGALKLKEISYIHAEGYPAGELKHGPIALIDAQMPVVAIATSGYVYEKILSNIQEVRARKGRVIAIAGEDDSEIEKYCEHVLRVPELTESFTPFVVAIPLQLLAYHVANARGCDVDQPRNLAKSVTVE